MMHKFFTLLYVLFEVAGKVYLGIWVQGFVPKFYPTNREKIWFFALICGITKEYKKPPKHQVSPVFWGFSN